MARVHPVLGAPPPCCSYRSRVVEELRRAQLSSCPVAFPSCARTGSIDGVVKGLLPGAGLRAELREVVSRGRWKVTDSPAVAENGLIRSSVELPVTCYQIIGATEQAEKDEVVKSVMDLRRSEVEDGYTRGATESRQDLLMDVRDKLLFEPEYAGNIKEKVPPKSSLRIPWAWLPGALCLLQEVGEEQLVLEIGRAALQRQDAKPYVHDLLLSMSLAECSIAKASFEKKKVSQGFDALARAQYLLKSKSSLGKLSLLSQIEESLEELSPACTLEVLDMPHTPDNAERRRGAIAALHELLRQGLEVETSCRVQDWPCFLSQALNKLKAIEIVDLLSWDTLAIARKNKKSLASQNRRVVIDFNCFYVAMIAHIARGFSTRQTDLISKAKNICECLITSEGIDLKFEDAFCSLLLGQVAETAAIEKLQELEINGSPVLRNFGSTVSNKESKDKVSVNQPLERWLKDAVLGVFLDTRDCSPSLATFLGGQNKFISGGKQTRGTARSIPGVGLRLSSIVLPLDHKPSEDTAPNMNSTTYPGEAVKQLMPVNFQIPLTVDKTSDSFSAPTVQLKRNLRLHLTQIWESWLSAGDFPGRIAYVTFVGCVVFTMLKLFCIKYGQTRIPSKLNSSYRKENMSPLSWTMSHSDQKNGPAFIDRNNIVGSLGELLRMFKKELKHPTDAGTVQNSWPIDDCSKLPMASAVVSDVRPMPLEEADALLRQWQAIKAQALGPSHQIETLSEVLAESMLSQWRALANSAQDNLCFWRFVLLQLSILRADIVSDGVGGEMAEIEAVLEEAAELVEETQSKNPNYYSTYKMRYILKRQYDGPWKFCGGGIQQDFL